MLELLEPVSEDVPSSSSDFPSETWEIDEHEAVWKRLSAGFPPGELKCTTSVGSSGLAVGTMGNT